MSETTTGIAVPMPVVVSRVAALLAERERLIVALARLDGAIAALRQLVEGT